MTDSENEPDAPPDLGPALDLVRGLWREASADGLSGGIVAWAMIIEAVDHLAAVHGPAAAAGLLDRLSDTVRTTPGSGRGSLQ